MQQPTKPRRHVTGVDGLRALAVIAVIIYHLMPNVIPGGFLGVPIFLLISGYFVTMQLTAEYDQTGKINVLHFYHKRFKKLYPTLIAMLVATSAYIGLFQKTLLKGIRETVLTNLLWVYNWWEVDHGQSYFDRFNGESPFTHLWTLGVEVQFYVLWPLILWLLFILLKRQRAWVKWIVLALGIASAVEMAILYDPMNVNRVYYGTDTRAFSLMLGSFLGLIWPLRRLKAKLTSAAAGTLNVIGMATLLIMIWGFFNLSGEASATYHGAMFAYSLVGMLLLGTIVHPGAVMNRVLTNPVFTWLGQRSYGIYVYQFPVMIFYETAIKVGNAPILHAVIQTGLILGISELSYRWIERPLANYDWTTLPQTWQRLISGQWNRGWLTITPAAIMVILAGWALVEPAPKPVKSTTQARITKNAKETAKRNKMIAEGKTPKVDIDSDDVEKKYNLTASQVKQLQQMQVTAVGDSVMVDASSDLQELIPKAYIDGKVGRQANEAPQVLQSLANQGHLANTVILNLGTNGPITDSTVKQIMEIVGKKRQVYWLTAHVPTRSWQDDVNNTINATAKKYKNVHVVDWHGLSDKHDDWFAYDHVHMEANGNVQFTRLIATQLLKK